MKKVAHKRMRKGSRRELLLLHSACFSLCRRSGANLEKSNYVTQGGRQHPKKENSTLAFYHPQKRLY